MQFHMIQVNHPLHTEHWPLQDSNNLHVQNLSVSNFHGNLTPDMFPTANSEQTSTYNINTIKKSYF